MLLSLNRFLLVLNMNDILTHSEIPYIFTTAHKFFPGDYAVSIRVHLLKESIHLLVNHGLDDLRVLHLINRGYDSQHLLSRDTTVAVQIVEPDKQ